MNVIETNRLTKSYGKSRGIIDLNLSVKKGEFFGFIGPNGAGKSTTIRTLLGLISPTSGSAKIFGKDIIRQKSEILADVGYMPSETTFYSGMTVRDVIALSGKLRKKTAPMTPKSFADVLISIQRNGLTSFLSATGKRFPLSAPCSTNLSCIFWTSPQAVLTRLCKKNFLKY